MLFFTSYGSARSTTCGSVSSLQVGGQLPLVTLHFTRRNLATLIENWEVDLEQPWNDFDSNYPLIGTSFFLPWQFGVRGLLKKEPEWVNGVKVCQLVQVMFGFNISKSVTFGEHAWEGTN